MPGEKPPAAKVTDRLLATYVSSDRKVLDFDGFKVALVKALSDAYEQGLQDGLGADHRARCLSTDRNGGRPKPTGRIHALFQLRTILPIASCSSCSAPYSASMGADGSLRWDI